MSDLTSFHRPVLYIVDGMSAVAILATFAGFLPPLAALAGIFWYGIQIYESKTVQGWLNRKKPADVIPEDHTP